MRLKIVKQNETCPFRLPVCECLASTQPASPPPIRPPAPRANGHFEVHEPSRVRWCARTRREREQLTRRVVAARRCALRNERHIEASACVMHALRNEYLRGRLRPASSYHYMSISLPKTEKILWNCTVHTLGRARARALQWIAGDRIAERSRGRRSLADTHARIFGSRNR